MKRLITLILLPVLLTPTGEFLLKHTVNGVFHSPEVLVSAASIISLILQPYFLLGAGCIVAAGGLWLIALSKYELSFLYPFMSINYLVILGGSGYLLNEKVSIVRYLAAALIVIGLIFISRSKYAHKN